MSQETTDAESMNVVENNANQMVMTVKSVRVVEKTERMKANTVFLTFKEEYDVFARDVNTGLFVKTKTNVMSKSVGIMTTILSDLSDDMSVLMSMPIAAIVDKPNLSEMEKMQVLLASVLVGSKVVITSEEHAAGEIIDGVALTRDQMFNDIVNVVLTDRAKKVIEDKVAKLFEF